MARPPRHLERRLATKLERNVKQCRKVQQEIGSDIFNLGEYVRPLSHYWKEIDWKRNSPGADNSWGYHHIRRLGIGENKLTRRKAAGPSKTKGGADLLCKSLVLMGSPACLLASLLLLLDHLLSTHHAVCW